MSQQPEQNKTAENLKDVFARKRSYRDYADALRDFYQRDAVHEAIEFTSAWKDEYASQQTASLQKQVDKWKNLYEAERDIDLQAIVTEQQQEIESLQKQVGELRKCNDQILMKSIGQHERIAQLEEVLKAVEGLSVSYYIKEIIDKALNPQDNQKEK